MKGIVSPARFNIERIMSKVLDSYCPRETAAILDVGCGGGGYVRHFLEKGITGSYLGIDIERSEKQKQYQGEKNGLFICFQVYDAEKLDKQDKKFNFVLCLQALEHIRNDDLVLRGVAHCLEEGRYCLLSVPSKFSYLLYGKHGYRRYNKTDLKTLVGDTVLSIVNIYDVGGSFSFLLHFITWTIPCLFLHILSYEYYQKYSSLGNIINLLERFCCRLDRVFPIIESGYCIVCKKVTMKNEFKQWCS